LGLGGMILTFFISIFYLDKHKQGNVIGIFTFYKTKDAKDSPHVKNTFSYPTSQNVDISTLQPMQQDYYLRMP